MEANKTLLKADPDQSLGETVKKYFCSGVGKRLHLVFWSRLEVMNPVHELSREMSNSVEDHVKAMHRVMRYYLAYPEHGWTLKPSGSWDGNKIFEFVIKWRSYSDSKCAVTRRSIRRFETYLMGALISAKSVMQKVVALSVAKVELIVGVTCAQDMLYIMRVLELSA